MSALPRRFAAAAILAIAIGAAAGCSGESKPSASAAFCDAADRYNSELVREQTRGKVDVDRQITRFADLARTAPRRVRHDAQVFLAALRRAKADPSVKHDPAVRRTAHRAINNVNRLANQACGVYDNTNGF